jgi:hypothetical protein
LSLWEHRPDGTRLPVSAGNLNDYVELGEVFSDVAAYLRGTQILGAGADSEEIPVDRVTWNLWSALRVAPVIGRTFTADDARPGAAVGMVTDLFWRQRLGAPASLADAAVTLDNVRRQ